MVKVGNVMNDLQVNSADKIRMGKKVRIRIRIFSKLALLFVDPIT